MVLPSGMPRSIFRDLRRAWVCGRQLNITRELPVSKGHGGSKKRRKDNASGARPNRVRKIRRD